MQVDVGIMTALVRMLRPRGGPLADANPDGFAVRIGESVSAGQGYAVRIDWPAVAGDGVSHDFVQFTATSARAFRRAERVERFWQRSAFRPLAVTVAPMTRSVFAAHRQRCTSRSCPTVAALYGMSGGAGACVQHRG